MYKALLALLLITTPAAAQFDLGNDMLHSDVVIKRYDGDITRGNDTDVTAEVTLVPTHHTLDIAFIEFEREFTSSELHSLLTGAEYIYRSSGIDVSFNMVGIANAWPALLALDDTNNEEACRSVALAVHDAWVAAGEAVRNQADIWYGLPASCTSDRDCGQHGCGFGYGYFNVPVSVGAFDGLSPIRASILLAHEIGHNLGVKHSDAVQGIFTKNAPAGPIRTCINTIMSGAETVKRTDCKGHVDATVGFAGTPYDVPTTSMLYWVPSEPLQGHSIDIINKNLPSVAGRKP